MDVKTFLEEKPDLKSFYQKVWKNVNSLQKRYRLFITLQKPQEKKGVLAGLPVSVKDNICTKGIRTTAGSKILEEYIPPYNATCIEKIEKAGGSLIGKTAMDEFGFGTFSTTCAYGAPKNPLDPKRVCGGSSGGAGGITQAASFPHIAIAESTGGSITAPAAFCGVVGLTPTYGRISRYGLIDYANSLDKIGVMGKTVTDVQIGLQMIEGYDPLDSTSTYKKRKPAKKNITIGVPKEYFTGAAVEKQVWQGIKKLESAGIPYKEVSLPTTSIALAAYYIIATAEASTNLARYVGMRYGKEKPLGKKSPIFNEYFTNIRTQFLGEEAKRRIILGTYARMSGYRDQYYWKALQVRRLVINDFAAIFKKVDALAAPSMPTIAPTFTEVEEMSPVDIYAMDVLTVAPNLAGIPHMSVPSGTHKNMPIGLHLIGNYHEEETLFTLGELYG